jgi:hypothetical protein
MVVNRRLGRDRFRDDRLAFIDDSDQSKIGLFQLEDITTATTRTLSWPDASGTIALETFVSDSYVP